MSILFLEQGEPFFLDRSVCSTVSAFGSNVVRIGGELTAFLTASNAFSWSSVYVNGFPTLNNGRRGPATEATLAEKSASWATIPIKDFSWVILLGRGNFLTASIFSGSVVILSLLSTYPANSTSPSNHLVFSGFSYMSHWRYARSKVKTWRKCASMSVPYMHMSSTTLIMFGIPVRAASTRRQNSSPAEMRPMVPRRNLYRPHGVMNVVKSWLASSSGTCQYPWAASNVLNMNARTSTFTTASFGSVDGCKGLFTY